MSGWDDDELPALPPRVGGAVEAERAGARVRSADAVPDAEVNTSDVLGSNPVSTTTIR